MNSLARNETQSHLPKNEWHPRNQTMMTIRDKYATKLTQIQTAAHLAHSRGDARRAITMMIDLICEESMMLHDMAFACDMSSEILANERVIRRGDIEVLMACGIEVDDSDAKLLAQVLLQKHQLHCAAAMADGGFQVQ